MARRYRTSNLDDHFETIYNSSAKTLKKLQSKSPSVLAITDSAGRPLVHRAVEEHACHKVQGFLAAGCSVNGVDRAGESPLHIAAASGAMDIAAVLLKAGGRVNQEVASQTRGITPLLRAVMHGQYDMVQFLLQHGSCINQCSALHAAIQTNNEGILQLLLEQGTADLEKEKNGSTPMKKALFHRKPGLLKLLLKYGADVNGVIHLTWSNDEGPYMTPLSLAIYDKPEGAMLNMLLDAGADPNQVLEQRLNNTKKCLVPVCVAMRHNIRPLKYLIKANCQLYWSAVSHFSPSFPNELHDSALHVAVAHGKLAHVELLLQIGFDCSRAGNQTKCLIAQEIGQSKDLGPLLKAYCSSPLTLQILCRNAIREAIGLFLNKKINSLPLPSRLCSYILLEDVF